MGATSTGYISTVAERSFPVAPNRRLSLQLSELIVAKRDAFASVVAMRHPESAPRSTKPQDNREPPTLRDDLARALSHLAESAAMGRPSLFAGYIAWSKVVLTGHGKDAGRLQRDLQAMHDVLQHHLPLDLAAIAGQYFQAALLELPNSPGIPATFLVADRPLAALAREYLNAVRSGDRRAASAMILRAVDAGATVRDVYLHVFQPVQREIGRLWQVSEVTVAQEHFGTAIVQMIMSQLYPHIVSSRKNSRCFVAACVEGEFHEVGLRMVADFLEMEGWATFYLGADTPTAGIVQTLARWKTDVLGISVATSIHARTTVELIQEIRAHPACHTMKILVGGHFFNTTPDLWQQMGADSYAADAEQSVAEVKRLLAE